MPFHPSISSIAKPVAVVAGLLTIGNYLVGQNQLVYILCVALLLLVCLLWRKNTIDIDAERPKSPFEMSPVLDCPEGIRSFCYELSETKALGVRQKKERLTIERGTHEGESQGQIDEHRPSTARKRQ